MGKQEIYALFAREGIEYEAIEHKAVYNMDDLAELQLPHPEADAKNLFVRDDKRRDYYLSPSAATSASTSSSSAATTARARSRLRTPMSWAPCSVSLPAR